MLILTSGTLLKSHVEFSLNQPMILIKHFDSIPRTEWMLKSLTCVHTISLFKYKYFEVQEYNLKKNDGYIIVTTALAPVNKLPVTWPVINK